MARGLLLLSRSSSLRRGVCEELVRAAMEHSKERLYVALHQKALENFPRSYVFDVVARLYAQAQTHAALDMRVLLKNLKGDTESPLLSVEGKHGITEIYLDSEREEHERLWRIEWDLWKEPCVRQLSLAHCEPGEESGMECQLFVPMEGCFTDPTTSSKDGVVLGGTFDRIHNGHKILLSAAALLARRQFTCGVTAGPMLKRRGVNTLAKLLPELIEPAETRIRKVLSFMEDVDPSLNYKIVPLHDPFGPSIQDSNLQAIVASTETAKGAFKVNEKRGEGGLDTLSVFVIAVADENSCFKPRPVTDDEKISSSLIRKRLLGSLLIPPQRKDGLPGSPYVVGLTGGIASGKSHISQYLKEAGATLIDCDKLGHQAYLPGTSAYTNCWPYLDGVGTIVPTYDFLTRHVAEKVVVILDAAVLLEAGWDKMCHEVWVPIVPPEVAQQRLVKRNNLSPDEAKKRLHSQLSNEERVRRAHVVFCSLWDYWETKTQVMKAWDMATGAGDWERQTEEMDALRAIFGDAILPETDTSSLSIEIRPTDGGGDVWAKLSVHLPPHYPSESPPTFQLASPHLNGDEKYRLSGRLEEIYADNLGEPVLYRWIEAIQAFLGGSPEEPAVEVMEEICGGGGRNEELPCFVSGGSLTDRKSHFQAHVVSVDSPTIVPALMAKLKQNSKILRATHNIYAYRICDRRKRPAVWYQDCEDDGETHAGSRLSHLLQVTDAQNVLVVVSRWYGGIHLGPDRFKHICNVARELLISQGFVQSASPSNHSKHKSKKKKKS